MLEDEDWKEHHIIIKKNIKKKNGVCDLDNFDKIRYLGRTIPMSKEEFIKMGYDEIKEAVSKLTNRNWHVKYGTESFTQTLLNTGMILIGG